MLDGATYDHALY